MQKFIYVSLTMLLLLLLSLQIWLQKLNQESLELSFKIKGFREELKGANLLLDQRDFKFQQKLVLEEQISILEKILLESGVTAEQ